MNRGAAALLCALALSMVPTAIAAPTWQGSLTAESLEAEAAEASAALLALTRYDGTGDEPKASSELTITAEAVHVETQQADPVVVPSSGGADVPTNPSPSHQDHQAATILGVANRATYRLEILALEGHAPPQVTMSRGCVQLEPSDRTTAQSQPMVNPTRTIEVDVSSAAKAHACSDGSTLHVTGSFCVVLWEWDAQLVTDSGVVELRSGYDRSDTDTTGLLFPGIAKSRQQYITVTNGELSMPMDASPHYAFLENSSLDAEGVVALRNIVGQVQHDETVLALDAASLRLSGQLALDLASQGPALQVQVAGVLESAEADGQLLTLAPSAANAPPWLALGVALLAVALVAWPARRAALRLRARMLLRRVLALPNAEPSRVEALCSRALALDPDLGLAFAARAMVRAGSGDLAGSLTDCQSAWRLLPVENPHRRSVARQAWVVCQVQGRIAERDEWLARDRQSMSNGFR